MTTDNLAETVLAFLDAIGVVLVRLVVTCIVSIFGMLPLIVLIWMLGLTKWPLAFAILGLLGYISLSTLLFIDYVYAINGKKKAPEVSEAIVALPLLPKATIFFLSLPAMLMFGPGWSLINKFIPPESYLRNIEFDMLLVYFASAGAFAFGVYFTLLDAYLSETFFNSNPSSNGVPYLRDTILFTLDIMLRGLFFDVLEHFHINISTIKQSSNLMGLFITFILRLSSVALAFSLVIELVRETKRRLDKLQKSRAPR